MTIKEAVVARVTALLAERSMRPVELAKRAGLTPSTVYSFLDPNRREATINVIQKICEGLGVSVAEFFDDEMFKELPHNTAAHLAVPFPTSAACRFLDLPPVNLRNLQLHLSKNSLAS